MGIVRPSQIRFVLIVSALGLAVLGQVLVQSGNLKWSISPILLSIISVMMATRGNFFSTSTDSPNNEMIAGFFQEPRDIEMSKICKLERLLAYMFLLSSLCFTVSSVVQFASNPHLSIAWILYATALVLLLIGLSSLDRWWTNLASYLRESKRVNLHLRSILPWIGLAAVLVLGMSVRCYDLQNIPPGLWHDEADNLFHARHIQQNPTSTPVFAPSTNLPSMFLFPIAVVIDLIGTSTIAGRIVSVTFGLLSIVAIFLFVRFFLGSFVGLLAAFLTAVMRWDIIWSRIGMHGISVPLFTILTAWLFLRALKSGRVLDYGFAGFSLGLGMWFYAPFRLFPVVLVFLFLHNVIFKKIIFRKAFIQIAVMGVSSLIVASPVIEFSISDPGDFFARTKATSIFSVMPFSDAIESVTNNIDDHWLMLNYRGDPNPRHNIPDAPMLDFWSSVLLILGLGVTLARWREGAMIVIPFWLLVMAIPSVVGLPWEIPHSLRMIGMVPPVIVMVTLGFATLYKAGWLTPWPAVRISTPIVAGILLLIIAFHNIDTYFDDQANDPIVYASFSTDQTLIAEDMLVQQAQGYTLFTSRHFLYGLSLAVAGNYPSYDAINVPSNIPLDPTEIALGAAIYLEPRDFGVFNLLQTYYPDGLFQEVRAPAGGEILFYAVTLSREHVEHPTGLDAKYIFDNGEVREVRLKSTQALWPFLFGNEETSFLFEWRGSLHVKEPGAYQLHIEGSPGVEVLLDNRLVLWDDQRSIRIKPAVGLHYLKVKGRIEDSRGFIRLLWQTPDRSMEVIPVNNLYRNPVNPSGLSGRFWKLPTKEDELPVLSRITPTMNMFYYEPVPSEPYVAVWDGWIEISHTGTYGFEVSGPGVVELTLDGKLLSRSPGILGATALADINLEEGTHSIRVKHEAHSPPFQIRIFWSPPGRPFQHIPIEKLSPNSMYMFSTLPDLK